MAKSNKLSLPALKDSPQSRPLLESSADDTAAPPKHSFVASDESNPFGGASKDDLLAVVTEQLGVDPNFEGSEGAIAVESLARIVVQRMAHADWSKDPKRLAVFIVTDRARALAATLNATKEPI